MPKYWLMKSEPDVYSIDDLEKDGRTFWEGVRNYTARNFMRDEMKVGDPVLFYHSNADPPGIAGLGRIAKAAYPDPHAFDPKSDYYDATAKKGEPRWVMVDVAFVEKWDEPVGLDELKAHANGKLKGMEVVRKGSRLSVQPVSKAHYDFVVKLARK